MTEPTNRGASHYVMRLIIGILIVGAVPAGAFAFLMAHPTNISRVCTAIDGEEFRLRSFAEEDDPWLGGNETLVDGEKNNRNRSNVSECGDAFILDPDAPDAPPWEFEDLVRSDG